MKVDNFSTKSSVLSLTKSGTDSNVQTNRIEVVKFKTGFLNRLLR